MKIIGEPGNLGTDCSYQHNLHVTCQDCNSTMVAEAYKVYKSGLNAKINMRYRIQLYIVAALVILSLQGVVTAFAIGANRVELEKTKRITESQRIKRYQACLAQAFPKLHRVAFVGWVHEETGDLYDLKNTDEEVACRSELNHD